MIFRFDHSDECPMAISGDSILTLPTDSSRFLDYSFGVWCGVEESDTRLEYLHSCTSSKYSDRNHQCAVPQ